MVCYIPNLGQSSNIYTNSKNRLRGLSSLWPPSVRDLSLGYCYLPPEHQHYSPASTIEGNTDPLSSRLREFSQQLKGMGGRQCVSGKELFWPLHMQGDNLDLLFWPHFNSIYVEYESVTACVKWMFERDDDYEDTDRDWVPPEDHRSIILYIRSQIVQSILFICWQGCSTNA